MNTFQFEIVTPDGIIFQDEVQEVRLPAADGQITILPHHIPLYSKLTDGEAIIVKNGKETLMAILGGIVDVSKDKVSIVSDYAVKADSIVLAHAQDAKKRAEEAKKNKVSTENFVLEDKEMRKAILELKIAGKIKNKDRIV